MSLRSCFMRCICVHQWVKPPAAPTVVGVGAGAAPDCVRVSFLSNRPTRARLGVTLLIRVRVKAEVWALTRRDAHPFLAVWAIFGIIALRCGNLFFSLESGRERDVFAASIFLI